MSDTPILDLVETLSNKSDTIEHEAVKDLENYLFTSIALKDATGEEKTNMINELKKLDVN